MSMRSRRKSHGFTLLEVVLATGIMAMIVLALYASLRIGLRARDQALSQVGPARAAEIAMDLVRRDLESALPPRTLAKEFYGQLGGELPGTSIVQFYTIGPAPVIETASTAGGGITSSSSRARTSLSKSQENPVMVGGGIERVDLLVRADGALVRRVTRNLLSSSEPTPDSEEVLCRGITAFTIRYYDGSQWADEWDSTQYENTLPMAVEVALELTRPRNPSRAIAAAAVDPSNTASYRATRTFLLPCRDEAVLTGGTQ